MADQIKQRYIIAMKGAPFTRKTEFATLIAKALGCPIWSLEDFLHVLGPDELEIAIGENLEYKLTQSPDEVGCMIINHMAKSNLLYQVVDNVVIDSPLSYSQRNSLILSFSVCPNTRFVIVECKPKDLDSWKVSFEDHQRRIEERGPAPSWHKAKSWDEIKDSITQHEYDLHDSIYNAPIISKLVLDPLEVYSECDQSKGPGVAPPFMDAIQHMISREEGPGVVEYHEWRKSHPGESCTSS